MFNKGLPTLKKKIFIWIERLVLIVIFAFLVIVGYKNFKNMDKDQLDGSVVVKVMDEPLIE